MKMNINNVTKTALRNFVDRKIAKRRRELQEEIRTTVTVKMEVAMTQLLGDVSELERIASRFEDLLTEKIHLIGAGCVPEYAKVAAKEANKIYKAHNYFVPEIVQGAISAILNPDSSYSRFRCEPLMDIFNELNAELQPQVKLLREGLDTLKKELHNAVSIESTGKRGYNALVALGLDMSDMPEDNPNLPTVVKLSVDVCVLNGDCDKQESA